jgi:hypothetical protein
LESQSSQIIERLNLSLKNYRNEKIRDIVIAVGVGIGVGIVISLFIRK